MDNNKEIRRNPYTGVEVELNPVEIDRFDRLMLAYRKHLEVGNKGDYEKSKVLYSEYIKGKNWFIENNIEAYMDLID